MTKQETKKEAKKAAQKRAEGQLARFTSELQSWVPVSLYLYSYHDCIYCGEQADTIDHLIPISYLYHIDRRSSMRSRGVTVDSCRECNSAILGSRIFFSFMDRLNAARQGIARRHRKALSMPAWRDAEIRSLGHSLQTVILKSQKTRKAALARLEWQDSDDFRHRLNMIREQAKAECPHNTRLHAFLGCP